MCLLACDLNRRGRFLKSSKNRSRRPKTSKNRSFFAPVVTFSLVVTKRLKMLEKSFLRWHLGYCTIPFRKCHRDSLEPSSFLKKLAQCSVKETDIDGYYLANGKKSHKNHTKSWKVRKFLIFATSNVGVVTIQSCICVNWRVWRV